MSWAGDEAERSRWSGAGGEAAWHGERWTTRAEFLRLGLGLELRWEAVEALDEMLRRAGRVLERVRRDAGTAPGRGGGESVRSRCSGSWRNGGAGFGLVVLGGLAWRAGDGVVVWERRDHASSVV
jgi:hypothetical protein